MFIKIAFRNLLRQRRRTFLLIAAIALGFSVVVLTEGLFSGYIDSYQDKIAKAAGGHVYIRFGNFPLPEPVQIMLDDGLQKSDISIAYTNKRVKTNAVFYFDDDICALTLVGMDCEKDNFLRDTLIFKQGNWEDLKQENSLTVFNQDKRTEKRNSDEIAAQKKLPDIVDITVKNGIIIPDLIAEEFGLQIGRTVKAKIYNTLIWREDTYDFVIAAIYKSSESFGANIYVDKNYLMQAKGYVYGSVDECCVFLNNPKDQDILANKIEETLRGKPAIGVALTDRNLAKKRNPYSPLSDIYLQASAVSDKYQLYGRVYTVTSLEDGSPDILHSPKKMNRISFSVLAFILFIIMFGISNAFKIILNSRKKEFGTMRAFGADSNHVFILITLEAVFLGVIGVLIGFLFALIILFIISVIPINEFSVLYKFTRMGQIVWHLSITALIPKIITTVFFVIIAVLISARKMITENPADSMRQ